MDSALRAAWPPGHSRTSSGNGQAGVRTMRVWARLPAAAACAADIDSRPSAIDGRRDIGSARGEVSTTRGGDGSDIRRLVDVDRVRPVRSIARPLPRVRGTRVRRHPTRRPRARHPRARHPQAPHRPLVTRRSTSSGRRRGAGPCWQVRRRRTGSRAEKDVERSASCAGRSAESCRRHPGVGVGRRAVRRRSDGRADAPTADVDGPGATRRARGGAARWRSLRR